MRIILALIFVLLLVSGTVFAQENMGITDDEVNAVANRLFCPVCENIPLDTCGTPACQDWRGEIRMMLENGMTAEQIIDDFVRRFGDRVVGTPRDPLLRGVSLITPWAISLLAAIIAIMTLVRKRSPHDADGQAQEERPSKYHDLLEHDISG